jgi:hypothetical protein
VQPDAPYQARAPSPNTCSSEECAANDPEQYGPDHAVVIIGWDEHNNWIVANQWSEYWGMYGTMLLPMDNDCFATTLFPLVRATGAGCAFAGMQLQGAVMPGPSQRCLGLCVPLCSQSGQLTSLPRCCR